jgi:ankyrin repeat protein
MVLRQWPKDMFDDLNGNTYTATIHCLVSGITKISRVTKIPEGLLLYRGFGGLKLPDQFYVAPKSGYKGFVEWGFISTTSDKAVAIQYTGIAKGRPFPTVLQVRPAAVDHGGDIGDYSQFPGEREFLWNPCSLLEAGDEPFMEITPNGIIQIIPVRMNNNVKTMTVEQLLNQKKVMHICGFEFLVNEVKVELARVTEERAAQDKADFAQVGRSGEGSKDNILSWIAEGIIEECQNTLEKHKAIDSQKFLDDEDYRKLVIEMLETKSHALSKVKLCTEALKQMGGDGSTPLMLAAEKGDLRRVKELVDQRKDLMVANRQQKTALHVAVASGHANVIEALLHANADFRAKDIEGNTALHVAATSGHLDVLDVLRKYQGSEFDVKDNGQFTPLHIAARHGHCEFVLALVNAKANFNALAQNEISVLDEAWQHDKCRRALQKLGADGWTPLLVAAESDNKNVQKYLQCRELLLKFRDKEPFPQFFQDIVRANTQRVEQTWTWGLHDKASLILSDNHLQLKRNGDKSEFSCALGTNTFSEGKVHTWSVVVENSHSVWVGIAAGIDDEKDLVCEPGSVGNAVLAFGSQGGDPIVTDEDYDVDVQSSLSFSSGQTLEFQLDMVEKSLHVKIEETLVAIVRNICHQELRPFVCMGQQGSVSISQRTAMPWLGREESSHSREHEALGFNNARWTPEMDRVLLQYAIPGYYFRCILKCLIQQKLTVYACR